MPFLKHLLTSSLFRILSALILLIPAFYNGFPLVYNDTGTYLQSGMEVIIPMDRPLMYGLFIRVFHLGLSLWLVLVAQALLVFYVLWKLVKLAWPSISNQAFLMLLLLLTSFTGLGWYTSQLMPDIFTFMTLGSMLLLSVRQENQWHEKGLFSLIFIFSINTHFSHYLIAGLTLLFFWAISRTRFIPHAKEKVAFLLPICLLFLSLGMGSLLNFAVGKTWKMNQGSHAYLTAKMLDSGVLQSFLADHCGETDYVLCPYQDSLPENSRTFLWDPTSPLYQHGGWKDSQASLNHQLRGILTSPKHLGLYAYNAVFSTISQLFQNDIGSGLVTNWYANPNSPPYQKIARYFPFELNQYQISRQNQNLWEQGLDFEWLNQLNHLLLIFSSLLLFYVFSTPSLRERIEPQTQLVIVVLLLGIFFNAMVTASLANVYDRLQARVSWVLVLAAVLVLSKQVEPWWQKARQFLEKK